MAAGAALFRPAAWAGAVLIAALLLLWPALWNGYPLLFDDSGTYVLQVPTGSLGWDRPPFYSFFLVLFHWRLTLWPAVAAQVLAAAVVLRLALGAAVPGSGPWRLVGTAALLAAGSALPWFAGQVMPDLFTGLLVLSLALLAGAPGALTPRRRWLLAGAATAMITLHLSHLPLAVAVMAGVLAWRWWRDRALPPAPVWAAALLPPVLAAGLLLGTNLLAHGRAAIAPYSGVFLLARLIEDGPARDVLARDCGTAQWALCGGRDRLPATADAVLWSPDSPLHALEQVAAPRMVAAQADAIVARAWQTEPAAVLAGGLRATWRQLGRFATGDGLAEPPAALAAKLARVFPPREVAAYGRSRQAGGELAVPAGLRRLHAVIGLAALGLCPLLLAWPRLPEAGRALALATLIALPVNAAITGALSGPHDRYQSRVMWLPLAAVACALPVPARSRRLAGMACA